MKFALASLSLVVLLGAVPTPYAGQQTRAIKALDAPTITALQRGEGHGMALVAELNHYPGPRHVLGMADHLGLTPRQRTQTQAVYSRMHDAAVPLGDRIIAEERQLDQAFQSRTISDGSLQRLTARLAELNGRLRDVHLSAHLAMYRILTPSQIQMYDAMRGYGGKMNMRM